MALFRDTTAVKKSSDTLREKFIENTAHVSELCRTEPIKEKRIKNMEEAFLV